jgi:hypothetical protein
MVDMGDDREIADAGKVGHFALFVRGRPRPSRGARGRQRAGGSVHAEARRRGGSEEGGGGATHICPGRSL